MRTAVVCLALVAFLALPVGTASTVGKPEEVGLSSERLQRVAQMIQRRIATGDLAGAVVAVARKGKVAYVNTQGVMDLETKQAMTPSNMFRIASMTKPVVGVGVMMMVEEGKLRLNDPVSRYIPEFRNMKVAVPQPTPAGRGAGGAPPANAGGQPAPPQFYTVPAQREITIKDLLTHVSGLGSGPMGNSDIEKIARKDGETLAQYIPRLGGTALEIPAGVALDLQPWRRIRDARPRDRDRLRHAPGPLLPHAHLRSARHERHHLLADRRADAARLVRVRPHAEWPHQADDAQ
jgi:CubicO group peptidase (beta-lactamase class C family)